MITHIVLFRWKPEMPTGHPDVVRAGLLDVAAAVPSVVDYRCGSDVGMAPGSNWDFGLVATCTDLAGWKAYMDHPDHQRVRSDDVIPWIADRASVQFES